MLRIRCRIKDYYLNEDENEEPDLDAVQNVEDAVVTRANGWTVGEFRRLLDTGDNSGNTRDRVITQARPSPRLFQREGRLNPFRRRIPLLSEVCYVQLPLRCGHIESQR